ncbi:MAG: nucleotide exchange factor GrpE [Proteobacteria bacterium]|nr:nucleotide exchange factor GrpE [Pseudomonadota bacterium]
MSAESDHKNEAQAAATEKPAIPDAERLATLERDNADLKDRLLRALAEMENLRRRAEREMQDQRAYAITKFAGDIIATADNLRRALDSLPKPAEGESTEYDAPVKALIDGVELTERELLKALEKNGVKKRVPMGEKFDPHRDQAMFEVPDETQPSGTVMQVVQSGYTIGERVLRPAMVGVSKGGPVRPAEPETPAGEAPRAGHHPEPRPAGAQDGKPKIDKRA